MVLWSILFKSYIKSAQFRATIYLKSSLPVSLFHSAFLPLISYIILSLIIMIHHIFVFPRANMRLAYQDMSVQRNKEEARLTKTDPKKAQQFERLGMGFAGNK